MCGIFGIISNTNVNLKNLEILSENARQRGKDSSGFLEYDGFLYSISRYDSDLKNGCFVIALLPCLTYLLFPLVRYMHRLFVALSISTLSTSILVYVVASWALSLTDRLRMTYQL